MQAVCAIAPQAKKWSQEMLFSSKNVDFEFQQDLSPAGMVMEGVTTSLS